MARAGSLALAFMMVLAVVQGQMRWVEDGCNKEGSGQNEHAHRCRKDGPGTWQNPVENDCSHFGGWHFPEEDFNTRCCLLNKVGKDACARAEHECEPHKDKYGNGVYEWKNESWHDFGWADQFCKEHGQRLCTRSELMGNICCSKGGMCDNYKIWTSTKDCGVSKSTCDTAQGCEWVTTCGCDPHWLERPKNINEADCNAKPECEWRETCACDPIPAGSANLAVCPDEPATTTTTTRIERWVMDGCSIEGSGDDSHVDGWKNQVSESAAPTNIHIRCCKGEGNDVTCDTEHLCREGNGVHESHYDGAHTDGVTFQEADKFCSDRGERLCTKDELQSNICCDTGGLCDNHKIWTSTFQVLSANQACATFTTDATCTAASGCEWSKVGDQWTCQNSVYYTQADSAHTCIIASLPLIAFAAQCFV